jgi:hypothetical protein
VKLWMPTRLLNRGRPRGMGKRHRQAPVRSTGVVGTACREGDLGNWGRSGAGGGRVSNVAGKGDGRSGKSERVVRPMNRVMPVEGRTLASGVLVKRKER